MHIFFHPDYTVGPGVSPGQPLARVADCTASGEFHPALKTFFFNCLWPLLYTLRSEMQPPIYKTFVLFFS